MESFYEDRRSVPLWLLALGLCCGAIIYFWASADYITATAAGVVTVTGFSGYRIGAARLFAFFGGLTLAIGYAPQLGPLLEPKFGQWFGTKDFANQALCTAAAGMAIMLSCTIGVRLLTHRLLDERPFLQGCNKWTGFSVGVVQGALVMLLFLGGLLIAEPLAKNRLYAAGASERSKMQQAAARRLVDVAEQTRGSAVAPWVVEYNPFHRVPQLARLQRNLKVLSDPNQLNRTGPGDGLADLQQDPDRQRAIDALRQDPEIRRFFDSGQPIDLKAALSLMDNQSIRKFLAQP